MDSTFEDILIVGVVALAVVLGYEYLKQQTNATQNQANNLTSAASVQNYLSDFSQLAGELV